MELLWLQLSIVDRKVDCVMLGSDDSCWRDLALLASQALDKKKEFLRTKFGISTFLCLHHTFQYHRQRGSTHGYLGSQAEARSEPHKLARKSHTSHSTIVMLCCSCIVVVANDWVSNCGRVMHNMYIEIRTSLTASADMINSKNSVLHHSNFQPDANQSRCSVNWTLSIKLLLHVAYYN